MMGGREQHLGNSLGGFWANRRATFGLLLLAGLLVFVGCGIKAPPVPPPEKAPPAVSDLTHRIVEGQVVLTWRVPEAAGRDRKRVAGFMVQRSKWSLQKEDCTRCPVIYTVVAEIDAADRGRQDGQWMAFTYLEALEQGFRYRYRITAFGRGRIQGTDSNIVAFEY
jgi:hypothetical protein